MANPQRQSILCPNCKKLISVSESKCPFCGTARPASWWKNNLWTRGFRDPNQFVKILITVNVGMYIIAILFNPRSTGLSLNPLTFLSPSNTSLLLLGATGTVPIDTYHRLWTLVSASFLHGGLLHIFFNMTALRQLASVVIREFGAYRMFVIYTMSGIIGFLISYLAGISLTIGASASVCGLIGRSNCSWNKQLGSRRRDSGRYCFWFSVGISGEKKRKYNPQDSGRCVCDGNRCGADVGGGDLCLLPFDGVEIKMPKMHFSAL